MSDDYKYKNLPRAANGIAPAQWDEKKKEWVPYDGINDVNIKNLKEVTDEINNIKVTQDKILERLDKPLDTQVTGSKVEYHQEILYNQLAITKAESNWYQTRFTAIPQFNNYKERKLVVVNTHDVPVYLRLTTNILTGGGSLLRYGSDREVQELELPVDKDPVIIDSGDSPVLAGIQPDEISCYVLTRKTPSEGSLPMWLIMSRGA